MKKNYFTYNGVRYYPGTIVELKEERKKDFGFCSYMKFSRYDDDSNKYCFTSLHDIWKQYFVFEDQIQICVNSILKTNLMPESTNEKIEPKYIDGIVEAWTWYIIIMFFALFIKGIGNTILIWVLTSIIFFNWRYNKINGK